MSWLQQLSFYFERYYLEIFFSLPYFIFTSVIGVLLILRRSSLFGLVTTQVAQFSFVIGYGIVSLSHGDAYDIINQNNFEKVTQELYHIDSFVFPLTLLLIFFLAFISYRFATFSRNKETVWAILFVGFASSIPLIKKLFGSNSNILNKAYFTEILYTPIDVFRHYIIYILLLSLLLFLVYRKIILVSLDEKQAKLLRLSPTFYHSIVYFIAGTTIAISVKVIGTYMSISSLLIPSFIALTICRSILTTIFTTIILSLIFTLAGFTIAFSFDNLPTEPLIITSFCFFMLLSLSLKGLFNRVSA